MKTRLSSQSQSVVRFMTTLHEFYADAPAGTRDLDDLLAYICEQNSAGKHVRSTDLVRMQRFGTLPTLTGKIHKLIELGLVVQSIHEDRREKHLEATPAAERLLRSRFDLLNRAGVLAAS